MKGPESYEKDDICKYLDFIGCWHFRTVTGGFGKSGVPDIIACIDGTFWGIEVKREGKQPTAIQQNRMEEIEKAGGYAVAGTAEHVIAHLKVALADA